MSSIHNTELDELLELLIPIHVKDKDYVKVNKIETREDAKKALTRLMYKERVEARIDEMYPLIGTTFIDHNHSPELEELIHAKVDKYARERIAHLEALITNGEESNE